MNQNSLKSSTRSSLVLAGSLLFTASSHAVLVIAGVTDGDLPGGIPKAIILQAGAPVADLSLWGVGSANNGGGTDGVEFTLPAGTAALGDVIVIAGNQDSFDFFANNFVQDFTLHLNGAANVNGDDAIELFQNAASFDVYGDIAVDGSGQTWDYVDGYALRTGGNPGAFDQANYSTNVAAFDTLDEAQHVAIFVSVGFTAVPEPSSAALALLGLGGLMRRRR